MVLTVILILITATVFAAIVAVLAPLQVRLHGTFDGCCARGSAVFSFLSPRVLRVSIGTNATDMVVRVFGRRIGGRRKNGAPSEEVPGSDNTPKLDQVQEQYKKKEEKVFKSSKAVPPLQSAKEELVDDAPPVGKQSEDGTAVQTQPTVKHRELEVEVVRSTVSGSGQSDHQSGEQKKPDFSDKKSAVLPDAEEPGKEKVAPLVKKKDNWHEKLRRNIAVHFLGNRVWRTKVVRWLLRFLKSLLFLVHFDRLRVQVRGGVEDPMITGSIAGYCQSLESILGKHRYLFSFEPVFMRNAFDGAVRFRVSTSLFSLLFPVLCAVISFPWVRTLLLWLSYRRIKKRYNQAVAA